MVAHAWQSPDIAGYTFGSDDAPRSPVSPAELGELIETVGLTDDDRRHLERAGAILEDQAGEMVDFWRSIIAGQPHLARYAERPDGTPDAAYSAASHPRFARWIVDLCRRPYDQAWLD